MTILTDSAQFTRALRSAVLWPIAVIFAAGLLLVVVILQLFAAVRWSNHSFEVLGETHQCETLLVGSQNDVRAYLLTGDEEYAKAYALKKEAAEREIERVKALVSDNPAQIQNVQAIINAKNIWLEHAQMMISQRAQGVAVNPGWVRMGTRIVDDVGDRFQQFVQAEIGLRDQRLRGVRRMKNLLAYAGSVLAVLLTVTIVYQVRRQMLALVQSYRSALTELGQRHEALVRSEHDLEEQKERLRVTLTSIGDGVIVTDPEGRLVMMNYESERLTGWRQSEALHQPLTDIFRIVNEETRAKVADPVAKVLQEKKTVGLANHTVLLSRSGEEWPIEDSAAPILGPNGTLIGVILVFHDASPMRHAQRSLKAYSADLEKIVADRTLTLQQTVSELEAFSYSVSHDLRSPLRAMQGFSDALIEDYADKLDDPGRHYLQRIKAAAGRLELLIEDLLSYTRISRLDSPLEALDLDRMVRDIIELDPQFKLPLADVKIVGYLPKVLGREASINQVFANLLGNAVKFVHKGETAQIRISAEDKGARVRIAVEDHGIGIPPAERDNIFKMFVQINEASVYGGTGVGLAIVKKAVQTLRGTVEVEAVEGGGSRFWVELAKA